MLVHGAEGGYLCLSVEGDEGGDRGGVGYIFIVGTLQRFEELLVPLYVLTAVCLYSCVD
jgi:hypothetical protein